MATGKRYQSASNTTASAVRIPITVERLVNWGGQQVLHEARRLVEQGLVLQAQYQPPWITGTLLHSNRSFNTRLRVLPDGNVESECPCYANRERDIICPHVIALGLVVASRCIDPMREQKRQQELQRASNMAQIDEAALIPRVPAGTPGALPAAVLLCLDPGWIDGIQENAIPLQPYIRIQDQTIPIDQCPHTPPLILDPMDETLLFALEDIAAGPVPAALTVTRRDCISLLAGRGGGEIYDCERSPILIHRKKVLSVLSLELDHNDGTLRLAVATSPPFLPPGDEPVYLVDTHTAWVYAADHLWPLANVLPEPYQSVYQSPLRINRPDVLRFLHGEVPLLQRKVGLHTDVTPDLFRCDPGEPDLRLEVRGSPASLVATLTAHYGEHTCIAGKPTKDEHFSLPDPEDLLRYLVRNPDAEQDALTTLQTYGLSGATGDDLSSLVGTRHVRNFLGAAMPALQRKGWTIQLEGRIKQLAETLSSVIPIVHILPAPDANGFDVSFHFEHAAGDPLRSDAIHDAIRKGDAYIEHNGEPVLIDTGSVAAMLEVFEDCATGKQAHPGCFRLPAVYTPFVASALQELEGVRCEDNPQWRQQALRSNRLQPLESVDLAPHLKNILRPYQKEGVDWLRFLEANGFCGLLADEMGLGKTLQALAWLQLPRLNPAAAQQPALVICPTSLVQNWAEEAARFAPDLHTLPISGSQRAHLWEQVHEVDLVITSYALLRRDIQECLPFYFSAVILDEAQHIKNHNTRNAQAAKQLRAHHKLVLTGTPVENGVADLWSIMDFLMPGYLGSQQQFRDRYERPISRNEQTAPELQQRLQRKLHPFLLRRRKRDVARDLPPKIARMATCQLSPDQQHVYRAFLDRSRRRIRDIVSTRGFQQARMEILTTLLRLRQICCHLDLLEHTLHSPERPSAKLELFAELVDEAIDSGHRILVFSQFTSMLHILRQHLQQRDIAYCYLDGSTKNRMEQVHQFNTSRTIPIFLISLKAGGTGLNLTGADMVIHYDPWWNPAVENQATDRAYRIGQHRTVYSIKLITKGTVEEKVLAMQNRKKAIIEATVESSDNALPNDLDWEDVQTLLQMDT